MFIHLLALAISRHRLYINKKMDYTNGKIYKITNLIDGKIYIGRTKYSLKERFRQHVKNKRGQTFLGSALRKHGVENFTIELVELVSTIDMAMERERYWIKELNAQNREIGYNLTEGGDDKKIVAKSMVKNRDYLFTCPETNEIFETMEDIAQVFNTTPSSVGRCVAKGIKLRRTYTFLKIPKNGKELTAPSKIKREHRSGVIRKIKCVETGQIFESANELAKSINFSYMGVRKIIKNKTKCGGFSYEFIDEKAHRDTRNGTAKVSKPIKRLEDNKTFHSLNAMARELGFSGTYASYVMKKMNGIHNGFHYIFL